MKKFFLFVLLAISFSSIFPAVLWAKGNSDVPSGEDSSLGAQQLEQDIINPDLAYFIPEDISHIQFSDYQSAASLENYGHLGNLEYAFVLDDANKVLGEQDIESNNMALILGAVSDISDIYMTDISIILGLDNWLDAILIDVSKDIDTGLLTGEQRKAVVDFSGEGYKIQNSNPEEFVDFDGDGIAEMFWGEQQSATSSITFYYVVSVKNIIDEYKTTNKPPKAKAEFLAYNFGRNWPSLVDLSKEVPKQNYVPVFDYLVYPIDLFEDGIYELRQVIPLRKVDDEDSLLEAPYNGTIDAVVILDWKYYRGSWNIIQKEVKLREIGFSY